METFFDSALLLLENLPMMFVEDYSSACLHAELLYRDVALLLLDDSLNGINGLDEALSDIQNVLYWNWLWCKILNFFIYQV